MDYTLYPIKKTDVNWPLYYLVSHFLKLRYELDEVCGSDVENAQLFQSIDDDAKNEERKYQYEFVFPFDDLTLSYNEAMLGQEAMILKCFFDIEHPDAQYIGDDEHFWYENVPMEYFHFVGSGSSIALKHFHTDLPSHFPNCAYNGDAFLKAINGLLAFLRERQLTELPWYSRLQTVVKMLNGNANELHIIHNAGLFDHHVLWPQLEELGVPKAEIEKVKEPYLMQLHRYAMFVLNELNWQWGNPIKKEDREKRWGLFSSLTEEQQAATVEEQARRQNMMGEKYVRPETKIKMPVAPEPMEETAKETAKDSPKTHTKAAKKTPGDDKGHKIMLAVIVLAGLAFAGLSLWVLLH